MVLKKAIILANGDSPKINEIKYLKEKGYNYLVCADGGANSAKKLNLMPNVIIGDLDSVTKENLKYFKNKSEIIKYSRQNDTDVEKSLKHLIKKKYDHVILLGATGDRLDHTICNLGIVLKFYSKIKISILHQNSYLTPYKDYVLLNTAKNELISLYGFSKQFKISSIGLKYPLKNVNLLFGEKESTSNVALNDKVELFFKGGIIFVIREFKILRKYDLL